MTENIKLILIQIEMSKRETLGKKISESENLHNFWTQWSNTLKEHDELETMLSNEKDTTMLEMVRMELDEILLKFEKLEKNIKEELLREDQDDCGSAILEIRAGIHCLSPSCKNCIL